MNKYWKLIGLSKHLKQKTKIALISLTAGTLGVLACAEVNNPFNPSAQIRVVDIAAEANASLSGTLFGRVGIAQKVTGEDQVTTGAISTRKVTYNYSNPVISIQNQSGLPGVTFTKGVVRYRLSDIELPLKEFPINLTVGITQNAAAAATQTTVTEQLTVPMLNIDDDVRKAIFPGDSLPAVEEGLAELVLFGKDFNGNEIKVEVPIPLRFSTNRSSATTQITASPTPAPTPAAGASPTSGSGG